MDEFVSFLIEEVRMQLDKVDEATNNARRYLERLETLLGGR